MRSRVFRYVFSASVSMEEVESSLLLAVLGAESLHGETEVQLNAGHFFEPERRTCVVDAETEAGRNLNKLFAGYLRREFGRHEFTVRRIKEAVPSRTSSSHAQAGVGSPQGA